MKRALILGIGGQDGSYLAELLLEKGYEVHGLYRRSSVDNLHRIAGIRNCVTLHKGDLAQDLSSLFEKLEPLDEVYNEADQDNVDWSYATPAYSMDITAGAVGRILESLRQWDDPPKFFQPLSATMFGNAPVPQNEQTPFAPTSPYACAKVAAYYLCQHYRREYGMFVSTAIMYNHDSPRRGEGYLLQKICKAAVMIAAGKQEYLEMGNLDAQVDIGFSGDYMKAAWQIMQLDNPDDFVLSSSRPLTIRQLVQIVFEEAKADIAIRPDSFHRPGKTPTLIGNSSKAVSAFEYNPETSTRKLIQMIVAKYKEQL